MKLKFKGEDQEEIAVHEFIGVKGYKAKGKRLSVHTLKKLTWLEPMIIEPIPSQDEVLPSMETPKEGTEPGDIIQMKLPL
jgi:topoisomerase-4 subunit A